jgi:hypothetical protein
MRVFAGGGIAYVSHLTGFNTIDLSSPQSPVLIAAATGANFGWGQLVANGSGLGLAADFARDASLYDISDPTNTTQLLTSFTTPGQAVGVGIYNGIGYVADGYSGLQIVNYLAADIKGVPPQIRLESNVVLAGTGGTAEEGKLMRLSARVIDDVQVRDVEFFVDDVRVARDGNFPFEHRFLTPRLAERPFFTVKAALRRFEYSRLS